MPLTIKDVEDRVVLSLIEEYAYDPDAGAYIILDAMMQHGLKGLQTIDGIKIKTSLNNKKLYITICLDQ